MRLAATKQCCPDETECPGGCCPMPDWYCCPDYYCAAVPADCAFQEKRIEIGRVHWTNFAKGKGGFSSPLTYARVQIFEAQIFHCCGVFGKTLDYWTFGQLNFFTEPLLVRLAAIKQCNDCGPEETECPAGCCPMPDWYCCPDYYCACITAHIKMFLFRQ